MTSSRLNSCVLDENTLKIIAALSMLVDHIGMVLLPDVDILRIIGRIAFPIYAYMIAEGCAYTKKQIAVFFICAFAGHGLSDRI